MTAEQQFLLNLALYAIIALAVITVPACIVGAIAFYRTEKGAAKTFSLFVRRSGVLEIATIVVLALIVFALSVLSKIPSEAVIAIVSSIVGYVLGGHKRKDHGESEKAAE